MANRFYVPDAVDFSGVQLYQPNFEMLNTVLANKQERWDLVSEAARKMPQAFGSVDQQRRAKKIRENEQRMTDLGSTFKLDLSKGDQALDDFLLDIESDFTPGGEAYQIQKNYEAATAYSSMVDKMYQDGKITNANKVNWLTNTSASRFGGTNYDPATGSFTQFDGIDPAIDVDMAKMMDDIATGWERTILTAQLTDKAGNLLTNPDGSPKMARYEDWVKKKGGYYHMKTGVVIPYEDVYNGMMKYAMQEPSIRAYLQQETDIAGITDPTERQEYMLERMNQSASLIGEKYSSVLYKDNLVQAWQDRLAAQHGYKMKELLYQHRLDNPPGDYAITTSEATTRTAASGADTKAVQDHVATYTTQAQARVKELSQSGGWIAVVSEYNKQMEAQGKPPLDETNLLEVHNAIQSHLLQKPAGISPGKWGRIKAGLAGDLDQIAIGEHRMQIAESIGNSVLSDTEKRTVEQFQQRQAERAKQLVEGNQSIADTFSEADIVSMANGETVTGKDGEEYFMKNGAIRYYDPKGYRIAGPDGGDIRHNMIFSQSRILSDIADDQKTVGDAVERKQKAMDKYLGKPIDFSSQGTEEIVQGADFDQNEETRKVIEREAAADPAKMIQYAVLMDADTKAELLARPGTPELVGSVKADVNGTDANGETLYHMTFRYPASEDGTIAERTERLLVPMSAVPTNETMKDAASRDVETSRFISALRQNGITKPIEMPSTGAGLKWMINDQGDTERYIERDDGTIDTYVSTGLETAIAITSERRIADKISWAGISRQEYEIINKELLAPHDAMNRTDDELVRSAMNFGLTVEQLGILTHDDPEYYQKKYGKGLHQPVIDSPRK